MDLEEIRRKAQEARDTLPPIDLADLAAEQLRADLRDFFERVPEPPAYRRKDDPQRELAKRLIDEAQVLWARLFQLEAESGLKPWQAALEAHVGALVLTVKGQLEAAERKWLSAVQAEKDAGTQRRAWMNTEDTRAPVFDRAQGNSRYDAGPASGLKVMLPCPSCREKDSYSGSARTASHSLRCKHCGMGFSTYLAEVRSFESKPLGRGRRRFFFRLEEPDGAPSRLEFDSLVEGELPSARGDLLAFVYSARRDLKAVCNLSSGRLLWVQPGGLCFIASAVFEADAPELATFRAFRDQRLLPHRWGRWFVDSYYAVGPTAARVFGATATGRRVTRVMLTALHRIIDT